ncbi:small glutamine-rich tetratricopeptide repeat-containing protein 2-like [Bidens hawaiensis]|uniref:small glutamine-rich tetratricopeptide repeat-containing protein 2-like n=1 Tax=Bidens hawaiensis TaxID=980011 RepID=UPI00404A4D0D
MKNSRCEEIDLKNLADAFKLQGNKAMQSKVYVDAIELYTIAIALCDNNAVYYCNRAAAYTQNNQHTEAIHDCNKAIEIDPNYSKAYSRLGFSYFSQGKYRDAIDKGFKRALQLDPNNESARGNIQVAEQKLREERQRARQRPSSLRWFVSNGSRSDGPMLSYSDYTTNMSEAEFSNMLASMREAVQEHDREQEQAGNADSGDPMMERFYQCLEPRMMEHQTMVMGTKTC